MDGDQVIDEGITTPGCGHPVIGKSTQSSPHDGALLESLDPKEKGKYQQENGDGLIVVATSDGSRDVTRGNAHEGSGQKTGRVRGGQLIGQPVRRKSSETGEAGGEKNTDISNIDGNGQETEQVVYDTTSDHEAGVEGSSSDPTEGVPGAVIKPIPEAIESIGDQVLCSPEVEPRVDWEKMCQYGCVLVIRGKSAESCTSSASWCLY